MITLMARQGQRQWKTMVAMLLALPFGLLQFTAVAAESTPGDVDAGKVIMVNNVWVDVSLTQVFRDISIETGVVIAVGPQVPDPLVSLDAGLGKPLQGCLRELVAGQGLFVHEKSKRFYLITSGDSASPGFMEAASSKRLYLKYVTAKHLRASLPRSLHQYVTSGERPNEVLIYAVPEIIKRVMEIVAKLDIPRRQVVLEVLVVDLWEDAGEEFGLDWGFTHHDDSINSLKGLGIFEGVANFTTVAAEKLSKLEFTLKALISEKKASIRSRPRVATLNGEKASIDISLDEYFAIATDLYGTTGRLRTELEVIKSGVLLEITPQIGDNGDITVHVHTVVSDVASRRSNTLGNSSGADGDLPVIRRREANTRVRVKEGDAVVIGGLVETQERTEDKRVPVLSSIPLVGGLFTSKENTTVKKEVIILITPRLIKEGQIALSDRHTLISEEEEIEKLRDVVTLFDVRHKYHQNSLRILEEIRCLRDVVTLLDGQDANLYDLPDTNDEEEFLLSRQHNLPNVANEIERLREVVALLDVQAPCGHSSLDIDKEHESSRRE